MATCLVKHSPDQNLTGIAGATVTGNRFVRNTGAAADGANFPVQHATAGAAAFAISGHDIANGARGHLVRPGCICTVEAGATVAAGAVVEVTTAGKAITQVSGIAVGQCLTGGDDTQSLLIWFYAAPDGAADAFAPEAFIADPTAAAAKTMVGTTAAATAVTAATVATADGSDAATTQALANQLKVDFNKMVTDMANARTTLESSRVDLNKGEDDIAALYTALTSTNAKLALAIDALIAGHLINAA